MNKTTRIIFAVALTIFGTEYRKAHAETTSVKGPSGRAVLTTTCKSDASNCYAEASHNCGGGSYQILSSESHSGGLFGDAIPGPVSYYSVSYSCGRSDGRMADFPRSGPYWQPPRPFIAECSGNYGGVGCAGWR